MGLVVGGISHINKELEFGHCCSTPNIEHVYCDELVSGIDGRDLENNEKFENKMLHTHCSAENKRLHYGEITKGLYN